MGRKIFVTYKYNDEDVHPINGGTTARAYVEELIDLFKDEEIYKGEGSEDLSRFKDETIKTHLKQDIYDSSITIILISPAMKEKIKSEADQWIPWEVSYSLKEVTRNDRTSHANALLAIVLPDQKCSYEYFLSHRNCPVCNKRIQTLKTSSLFKILRENMFNIKRPEWSDCNTHNNVDKTIYTGYSSYIYSIRWDQFNNAREDYLKIVEKIRENIDDYALIKEVD